MGSRPCSVRVADRRLPRAVGRRRLDLSSPRDDPAALTGVDRAHRRRDSLRAARGRVALQGEGSPCEGRGGLARCFLPLLCPSRRALLRDWIGARSPGSPVARAACVIRRRRGASIGAARRCSTWFAATSTARLSRITVTLIWPGYSRWFSISRAISCDRIRHRRRPLVGLHEHSDLAPRLQGVDLLDPRMACGQLLERLEPLHECSRLSPRAPGRDAEIASAAISSTASTVCGCTS